MHLVQLVNLVIGRVQPSNDSQKRYARITQAVLTGLAGKGVSAVTGFISVPLTISYLGGERYGVWITISTLLVWFQLADLGVGSSMINALSEAYAKDRKDLARDLISTALLMLTFVSLLLLIISFFIWNLVDWNSLFNVHSALARAEAPAAVEIAILIFLLNLPLSSIVTVIYTAHQEGIIINYWTAISNIANLVGIIIATQWHYGLIGLVLAFSGLQLLFTFLNACWLFGWHKPWLRPNLTLANKQYIRQLANTGSQFFVIQVAGLLIFQTDNLIIAYLAGADQVTPYSVSYRLFSYTTLLQMLIFPNLWSAYREAIARKDIDWVRHTFRLNITFSLLSTLVLAILLIFFGTSIIELWAGSAAVPPFALLIWMGGWSVINSSMSTIACLLSSSGEIRMQMIYAMLTAITNVVLSIILIKPFGITGVIAATVITYSVCNVIPASINTIQLLRKLSHEL